MRTLKIAAFAAAALVLAAIATAYGLLRGSLPQLDGELHAPGLGAAVRITRDALGVPTLEAADRLDLAYATGFAHAQDRFFQMDLSRRLAAGELAELFGPVALDQDRQTRLFRFRAVARRVLEDANPRQRALLESYARGVNAGLARLRVRPWEYLLLGAPPAPWRAEDSVLVVHAMWWDLQVNGLRRERLRQEINARLGGPQCVDGWRCALGFLYPAGTSWDAPAAAAATTVAEAPRPVPDASALNVRGAAPAPAPAPAQAMRTPSAGSNSWAVSGALTSTGAALIANDMHLGQRVPPVWYRARLRVRAQGSEPQLDLNGVTLPGAPLLVAGSNGHIAWGFTNSYGNWFDVAQAPCAPSAGAAPSADAPLTVTHEEIRVRGAASVGLDIRSGPLGVLWRNDAHDGRCWFVAWLAQRPEATNLGLVELEHAGSVAEALSLAPAIGIPHQNVVLGDREGHIAWTIFGRIPVETAGGRARVSTAWTTAAEHPRIVDPPLGRLWTANARVASEPRELQLIGGALTSLGAEYDLGARASQIRDDLMGLGGAITAADMLRIQLDDRAVFLQRWQDLLLRLLDASALKGRPQRAEFRGLIEHWDAHASVESVGYRLVRAYHDHTQQAVWDMVVGALRVPDGEGSWPPAQFEGPLWEVVSRQPLHLLAQDYPDWQQFLLAQVDATIAALAPLCPQLARCTWGAGNTVRIRHPLSRALHLGRRQHRAHPSSALSRAALARVVPRHADAGVAGGSRHAPGPGRCLRSIRAFCRLTRSRERRIPAHSGRAERAPALALLPRGFQRVGQWPTAAVPAGSCSAHTDAGTRAMTNTASDLAPVRRSALACALRVVLLFDISRRGRLD